MQSDSNYKRDTNIYAFHKYLQSAGPLTLAPHDARPPQRRPSMVADV